MVADFLAHLALPADQQGQEMTDRAGRWLTMVALFAIMVMIAGDSAANYLGAIDPHPSWQNPTGPLDPNRIIRRKETP